MNFKSVRDSRPIKFGPLTALIGNNGSGKSSLVEGLEAVQLIAQSGLDEALEEWRGYEHALYKGLHRKHLEPRRGVRTRPAMTHAMTFALRARLARGIVSYGLSINAEAEGGSIYIQQEAISTRGSKTKRDDSGVVTHDEQRFGRSRLLPGESILSQPLGIDDNGLADWILNWQFLLLNPQRMGDPFPQQRTLQKVKLAKDGANVAQYLKGIRDLDLTAFEGIIETLQYVLPYARDVQPVITQFLEQVVYLELTESNFKVPGWLLSTGTLRVMALLALLRHPEPPPLIVIEEIENGLDPRTLNLIVEEIRGAIESGMTQVILTTHSPYLLDLLALDHIVLVERVDGEPVFSRPTDKESLRKWAEDFSPGKLYTMGRLGQGG